MGEKAQKTQKRSPVSTHGSCRAHARPCQKGQSVHTARVMHTHGRARLTTQLFPIFLFSPFRA